MIYDNIEITVVYRRTFEFQDGGSKVTGFVTFSFIAWKWTAKQVTILRLPRLTLVHWKREKTYVLKGFETTGTKQINLTSAILKFEGALIYNSNFYIKVNHHYISSNCYCFQSI